MERVATVEVRLTGDLWVRVDLTADPYGDEDLREVTHIKLWDEGAWEHIRHFPAFFSETVRGVAAYMELEVEQVDYAETE